MNLSVTSEYTHNEECCLISLVTKVALCMLKVKKNPIHWKLDTEITKFMVFFNLDHRMRTQTFFLCMLRLGILLALALVLSSASVLASAPTSALNFCRKCFSSENYRPIAPPTQALRHFSRHSREHLHISTTIGCCMHVTRKHQCHHAISLKFLLLLNLSKIRPQLHLG